ncbi:MAG: sulfotransferase family protein [Solirubrobacteraceae bacterium]
MTVSGRSTPRGGVDPPSTPPPGSQAGRLPDFFIVGHEKCGTSALDLMLKAHPQIFMPAAKEQKFFAPELRGGLRHPQSHDSARPRRLEEYTALFAAAAPSQRVGEASPQYLRSHQAAARIAEVQPDARIIAILREPAAFLRSFHLQWVSNRVETERDFRKALALEADRREGRHIPRGRSVPQTLFYSDHVRYVEQLERYSAVFGQEQMLVLIYDDLLRDNEGTVRRVLRFLDVDDTVPVESIRTDPLEAVRSPLLKHLADSARAARRNPATASALGRAIARMTPAPLRAEGFRARWRRLVYKQPDPPDAAFMRELRSRFKPEVVALSDYMGRDLVSEWGYDDVG